MTHLILIVGTSETGMSTLTVYLLRLMLPRFLLILFALVALVIGLDLMVNANSLLRDGGGTDSLLRYAVLRAPTIASEMIKVATLLAALLTFASLIQHGELTAIWGTGVSQFGLFWRLLPVGLLIGALQFAVDDVGVPRGVDGLRAWGVGEFRDSESGNTGDVTWLHVGTDIVRIPKESIGPDRLGPFIIFERDSEGSLLARDDVGAARYLDGRWILSDVVKQPVAGGGVERIVEREWRIALDPKSLRLLSTHPRHLSFDQIRRFAGGDGQGTWAPYLYRTWLYEKVSTSLVPLLMLLLAAALAQQSQRAGRLEFLFLGGVAVGFAFFIFNGVTLAMGEVGLLPPLVASTIPALAFTALAVSIIYWHELKHRPG